MLSAGNRLKKQADFSRVLKEGRRFHGVYLHISAATKSGSDFRLGMIVTKKTEKKAVNRNRLRRIISHIFEHLLKEKKLSGDVVVIVKNRPETETFAAFEHDIHQWYERFSRA